MSGGGKPERISTIFGLNFNYPYIAVLHFFWRSFCKEPKYPFLNLYRCKEKNVVLQTTIKGEYRRVSMQNNHAMVHTFAPCCLRRPLAPSYRPGNTICSSSPGSKQWPGSDALSRLE